MQNFINAWNGGLREKENDLFVMYEFVAQDFSKGKLSLLNACRKYLQVATLGEITNGDGDKICKHIKIMTNSNALNFKFSIEGDLVGSSNRPLQTVWKKYFMKM